ncbi:MAG: HAD hydrolase family protein [Candidatus Aminicenantes bacterium]|nr:HAD hydrolase family protein [Candidatus Aminicenantes bacterium]
MGNRGRAGRVRMILADVDGTLTDGSVTPLPEGEELKSYNTKDGLGVMIAQLAGLKVGLITGKSSKALEGRAGRLNIDELYQGVIDKRPAFDEILSRHGLSADEVAFIGDDLNDLPLLSACGLSAAPADAVDAVRRSVHLVCRRRGGEGAFRELVDFIIGAQKKWDLVRSRFGELFERKI